MIIIIVYDYFMLFNIMNLFAFTFDQYDASLLNKSIKLLNGSVHYYY